MIFTLMRALLMMALVCVAMGLTGRIFWMMMSSTQTVGSEILGVVACVLAIGFTSPTDDELRTLREYAESRKRK